MLQALLQSELQKTPEINFGLREVRKRIDAMGELITEDDLSSVMDMLYVIPEGVGSTSLNVRAVSLALTKAPPIVVVSDEDFV